MHGRKNIKFQGSYCTHLQGQAAVEDCSWHKDLSKRRLQFINRHSFLRTSQREYTDKSCCFFIEPYIIPKCTLWEECSFVRCVRKIDKPTISFIISVCPFVPPSAWNNSVPNGVCVNSDDKSQLISRKGTVYNTIKCF